jgi:hypothetical protein
VEMWIDKQLTIELDGMDACAREDAHERVAHLISKQPSVPFRTVSAPPYAGVLTS